MDVVGAGDVALAFRSTFVARVIVADGPLGIPEPWTRTPSNPKSKRLGDFIAIT
jgi:hypothetical protein